MPDLSHLDEAERKQIEEVLRRQHEEEEKEQEMIRWAYVGRHFVCTLRM